MQRLDQVLLTDFLQRLSTPQAEIVTILRTTILAEDPQVSERIEQGKWLQGYLKYESPQRNFVYAVGAKASGAVSFHAMTYYGSQEMRERYGPLLEPFRAGKSCFDFTSPDEVPISVLPALVHHGSQRVDESVARFRG
jgi:Domain of unknown function (DU1801)